MNITRTAITRSLLVAALVGAVPARAQFVCRVAFGDTADLS